MQLVRALRRELWKRGRGRIGQVLFCVEHCRMLLLHGFIKKTEKDSATRARPGAETTVGRELR